MVSVNNKQLVTSQKFILASSDSEFDNLEADGILVIPIQGLAFPSLSDKYNTFVINLRDQGVIEKAIFSVYLSDTRSSDLKKSAIIFGGYDLEKYGQGGSIKYVETYAQTGYWLVPLKHIKVGGESIGRSSIAAIIDTGTSYILSPNEEIVEVMYWVSKYGNCALIFDSLVCVCDQDGWNTAFPDLIFGIGDFSFVITPDSYFRKEADKCILLVKSLGPKNYWILGDVFLRNFYTIFDMEEKRIGFVTYGLFRNERVGVVEDYSWIIYVSIGGGVVLIGLTTVIVIAIKHRHTPSSLRDHLERDNYSV